MFFIWVAYLYDKNWVLCKNLKKIWKYFNVQRKYFIYSPKKVHIKNGDTYAGKFLKRKTFRICTKQTGGKRAGGGTYAGYWGTRFFFLFPQGEPPRSFFPLTGMQSPSFQHFYFVGEGRESLPYQIFFFFLVSGGQGVLGKVRTSCPG